MGVRGRLWPIVRRIWVTVGLTATAIFVAWSLIAYRANTEERRATVSESAVTVRHADGIWRFEGVRPPKDPTLVFFPGSLVDPRAYAPLARIGGKTPEPSPYTQPVWVFSSRTLPGVAGADIRFVEGNVKPVHAEMAAAAAGRNIWIVGGGDLAGQFYDNGLLDDIFVQVGSVTLGAGKPLLPRKITSPPLRLVSVRAVGTGFAALLYEVPRARVDASPAESRSSDQE